ncbi:MAG: Sb-PDE family phosphodiesterase [Phycisphaerae bacterium]|jgi:predicted metal-dependent phosphoesterase TrpH
MRRTISGVIAAVMLCAAAMAAEPRQEVRFPNLPDLLTLKCDLHMHTVFSDGYVWPTVRVDEAWREGLDVIALTDHIEYRPFKRDVPTSLNRPHEIAERRAAERGLLLIRGAEITRDTPPGHHNAIFLSDVDALDLEDYYAVFDEAQKQGAFVFWNHPGWQGEDRGQWDEWQQKPFEKKQLHGIEICNGDDYWGYAHDLAVEHGLTLLGDSDIHSPASDKPRTPAVHRTMTLVFAKERTVEAVRDALFAGRTAVWCENRLIGRSAEMEQLFPACVRVRAPHYRTDKHIWVRIDNFCELDLELQRIGEQGPREIKLPAGATTLLRFDVPAETLSAGLSYRVMNMWVGREKPLEVKLVVPAE